VLTLSSTVRCQRPLSLASFPPPPSYPIDRPLLFAVPLEPSLIFLVGRATRCRESPRYWDIAALFEFDPFPALSSLQAAIPPFHNGLRTPNRFPLARSPRQRPLVEASFLLFLSPSVLPGHQMDPPLAQTVFFFFLLGRYSLGSAFLPANRSRSPLSLFSPFCFLLRGAPASFFDFKVGQYSPSISLPSSPPFLPRCVSRLGHLLFN